MKDLISNHSALFTIVAFDLIVALLVFLYNRSVAAERRERAVAFGVPVIAALVNISGLFCGPSVVEVVATVGGLSLGVWLWSAMEDSDSAKKA